MSGVRQIVCELAVQFCESLIVVIGVVAIRVLIGRSERRRVK